MSLFSEIHTAEHTSYDVSIHRSNGETRWLGLNQREDTLVETDGVNAPSLTQALAAMEDFRRAHEQSPGPIYDLNSMRIHEVRTVTQSADLATINIDQHKRQELPNSPDFSTNAFDGYDGYTSSRTCFFESNTMTPGQEKQRFLSTAAFLTSYETKNTPLPPSIRIVNETTCRLNKPMTAEEIYKQLETEALNLMPQNLYDAIINLPRAIQDIETDAEKPFSYIAENAAYVRSADEGETTSTEPTHAVNLEITAIKIPPHSVERLLNCVEQLTDDKVYSQLATARARNELKAYAREQAKLAPLFAALEPLNDTKTKSGFWLIGVDQGFGPQFSTTTYKNPQDALLQEATEKGCYNSLDQEHRKTAGLVIAFALPSIGKTLDESEIHGIVKNATPRKFVRAPQHG